MYRCNRWHNLLVVVILVFGTAQLVSCRKEKATVRQGGPVSLIQALQDDSVTTIVLEDDYSVASEEVLAASLELKRNVTIEGLFREGPPVSLDLAFRRAAVVVCSECVVTLANLTLRNARRGSGAALDYFVGDDVYVDNVVELKGVYRLRLACTPGSDAAEVLNNTPRSKHLPPSQSGKQEFFVETVIFQGVTYPDALHLTDFTQDFPLTHLEGRGHSSSAHFGGYALASRNVVYLCEHLVSESCLAEKQADVCVNELIDSLLAQMKQGAGLAGPLLAAIIVPIVGVGALLAIIAVLALRRKRRKAAQQQHHKLHFDPSGASLSGDSFLHGPSLPGLLPPRSVSVNGLDSASDMHSVHFKSLGGRRSLELALQPRGLKPGWCLASTATADFVQPPVSPEAEVAFGAFLGAGSYGRVYRAHWAGQNVACKVIEHDKSTLAAVEAEADLMLTLNHPHLVKAYHYRTFTYTDQPQSEGRKSRVWSAAGLQSGHRASSDISQSSGGSSAAVRKHGSGADSAQQLGHTPSYHTLPASNSNSGSGSMARMVFQQQQRGARQDQLPPLPPQQQLQRQESHDVLVTNLSLGPEGAAEAAIAATGQHAAASSIATKGSTDSATQLTNKSSGRASIDERGMFGTCDSGTAVKLKAETWLVQEFCDIGTLGGVASSWDMSDECDEQMLERLQLLRDTAQGLEELHNHHVVHGDVNARNVLVSSSSSATTGMCAKVADLGLARCLAHHATHRTTNSCGTMSHMAPELLRFGRLSPAVDIYAFGIMMWELYSQGQAAFDKLHYGQFFETVVLRKVRPCVPAGMPPDYELLMRQCWAADPADRPNVSVLCKALQLLLDDRQRRVQEAAAAVAAASAAADASVSGGASLASSVPGVDVLPELQALLPQKPRGASPAAPPTPQPGAQQAAGGAAGTTAAAAAGTVQPSPNNSSGPLSVVSLSALFPDVVDSTPDTVLVIGEPPAAQTAAGVGGSSVQPAGSAAAVNRTGNSRHAAANRAAAAAAAAMPGSPLSGAGDLEAQLEKDQSVHNNRLWFV